jgi:hypothetical protein
MRNAVFLLMLFAALGCMKKQADGTYKVDTAGSQADAKKSGDELKADLKKAGEKLKTGAHKIRDSDTAKHVEEKAGESLEKAGQKLKEKARH